jgi:lipopolysaccharide/colanic/teichoic acid biosynthesis glycosyltransferase
MAVIGGAVGGVERRRPVVKAWVVWWAAMAFSAAAPFTFLPLFYVALVKALNPAGLVIGETLQWHIAANSAVNAMVIALAWSANGRLDRRLAALVNAIVALHGLMALVILLAHAYYSIRVMGPAVIVSAVLGLAAVALRARLLPRRVAMIGPWHDIARQIGEPIEHVTDPASRLHGYDLILTTFTGELPPEWSLALSRAMLSGKPVRHAAEYLEEARGRVSIEHFDVEHLSEGGILSYRAAKRGIDLALLTLAAPFAILITAVAGLLILLTMGWPVFFAQPRLGMGGQTFTILKLRTMRVTPAGSEAATVKGDARVTPLGRFLRRFRIDEIPQLWNIALGDMSFIGPRPEQPSLGRAYAEQEPAFAYRLMVKPGISGWAQVRAGYAANLEETRTKLGYDLYYLKYFSFALDLQIMLRTALTLVTGSGVR